MITHPKLLISGTLKYNRKNYIKHQWIFNIIILCSVDGSSAMGRCLEVS
jgi:hypothetical protein